MSAQYCIEPREGIGTSNYWCQWWFVIVSVNNGQVITTSEMYASKAKRTRTMNRLAKATGLVVRP